MVANSVHRHNQSIDLGIYDSDTGWWPDWSKLQSRHREIYPWIPCELVGDNLRSTVYKSRATTRGLMALPSEFKQNGGDVSITCRVWHCSFTSSSFRSHTNRAEDWSLHNHAWYRSQAYDNVNFSTKYLYRWKISIPNSQLKTIKYVYRKTKVIIKFHCNTISEWNEEILEGFKVEPVDEKLRRYISNWLQQVKKKEQQHDQKNNTEL